MKLNEKCLKALTNSFLYFIFYEILIINLIDYVIINNVTLIKYVLVLPSPNVYAIFIKIG